MSERLEAVSQGASCQVDRQAAGYCGAPPDQVTNMDASPVAHAASAMAATMLMEPAGAVS